MNIVPPRPIKVFFSYSRKDSSLCDQLEEHLSLLRRQGVIESWHDRKIGSGDEWKGEIDKHLEEAQIILLLISASFVASRYCYDVEMKRAMERHQAGEARVIPIILRKVDWHGALFGKLQALPKNATPVTSWRNRDEAFANVVAGIRAVVEKRRDTFSAAPWQAPLHNLPFRRNLFFVGRSEILKSLRASLAKPGLVGPIQVLSGLGGYGKTQTALEFAYRYLNTYSAAFWIRADTEAELKNDFVSVARLLNLPQSDAPNTDEVVRSCVRWFESHSRWLLIFDNVNDPASIEAVLPNKWRGHIVITSRVEDFDILGISEPIVMTEMSSEEAVDFLFKRTKSSRENVREQEAAATLASELGYLPLALEQAGACVAALKISIQAYLQSYRVQRLKLLEEFGPVFGDYKESVATTWRMNLSGVEQASKASGDLLRVSAFLRPDNIPNDIVIRGGSQLGPELSSVLEQSKDDPLAFPKLLRPLRRYSLVRLDRASNSYAMHRLVQEVVRSAMDVPTRQLWAQRAISALVEALSIVRLAATEMVIHLSGGLELIAVLATETRRDELELAILSLLGPALIATNGYASIKTGEAYRRAVTLSQTLKKTPITFQVLWGLWGYHYVRTELKEAHNLGLQLLELAASEEPNDANLGHTMEANRAMGSTLFTMGSIQDAQIYFRRALALYNQQIHGSHRYSFAVNPAVVCSSYLGICDLVLDGERAGLRESHRLDDLLKQEDHPFSRVYGSYWLAFLHQLRRDVAKTLRYSEVAIELSRQHHFPQWEAMGNILKGWCTSQTGDAKAGAGIIRRGLEKHESTGAQTLRPYFLLLFAEALQGAGEISEAKMALDDALACAAKNGEETWTSEVLRQKAELLLSQSPESTAEGETLFRKAIAISVERGANALRFRSVVHLCDVLQRIGKTLEARAILGSEFPMIENSGLSCDRKILKKILKLGSSKR